MKRFTIVILALIILTLIWLGIVLNAARFYLDFGNESRLIFKNAVLQFKVIYVLGIVLIGSYVYMLISKNCHNYF